MVSGVVFRSQLAVVSAPVASACAAAFARAAHARQGLRPRGRAPPRGAQPADPGDQEAARECKYIIT